MSHETALTRMDRQAEAARRATVSEGRSDTSDTVSVHQPVGSDTFLDHYFKRIDPQVAASFTSQQCEAMKAMFGARIQNHHVWDFRPTISLGRSRYYLVFLAGRDRRALLRQTHSMGGVLMVVAVLALLVALPVLAMI